MDREKEVVFLQGIPFNTPQPTPESIKFREGGASFFLRNPRLARRYYEDGLMRVSLYHANET